MDPLTLSLLSQAGIAAGGTLAAALPDIIPSRYEKDQRKKLQDLQRQQEMGMLGLTEQERRAIENQLQTKAAQSEAFAQAERQRLTSGSPQFGRELLSAQIADEAAQRQAQQAAQQILALDLQKQQQQEQEIRDLEAAQAEYKRRRAEAITAPLSAGAETAVSSIAVEKMLQMPPQQALPLMQQQYGLTPQEAQLFYGNQPQQSTDYLLYQSLFK